MVNEKMHALGVEPSAIRELFAYGLARKAEIGAEKVFDFSLGNPSVPAPDAVRQAAQELLALPPATLHGYSPAQGVPSARAAVADSLNRRFGTAYSAGDLYMTCGAAASLDITFHALVLSEGDEVIVISPYFFEYNNYITTPGGRVVVVPASEADGFMPDVGAIARAVTPKTKAVILNNPNNPTGVVYPAELLRKLSDALVEKGREYGTTIYVVSDEPYRELAYDGVDVPWMPNCMENVIVGYSWSKSLSLPGERIGYLVIPGDIADGQLIFDAAVVANRMLGFVNAPSLMQLTVARCLNESTAIDKYDANRKALYNGLHSLGFECAYPAGAFYLWVKTPIDEAEFVKKAKALNLLLVPGSNFGTPGYVRLAYCVSGAMIERSMAAFAKLAEQCGLGKE